MKLLEAAASYRYFGPFAALVLLGEAALCAIIIRYVAYTEIDWVAYMQEVGGVLEDGDYDYTHLKGDTGPLVYPGGFVYVYSALYAMTGKGADVLLAQYIFAGLYVLLMWAVLLVYRRSGTMPMYALVLLCLSRRVHSIFVLRLFNDGIAILLLFWALLLFTRQSWRWGCLVFSAAVSIKMNILLFAPGLLLLLLEANGIGETVVCLSICAGLQVLVALPFVMVNPWGYLQRSFDLGRVFFHKWTVNFKFVPKEVFETKELGLVMLALMVLALLAFAWRWTRPAVYAEAKGKSGTLLPTSGPRPISAARIVSVMFESNFVGIAFARSLHYQFYSWYFHTLPLLLWQTDLPVVVRLLVLVCVEVCFNIFPATPESSMALQVAHLVLLLALFKSPSPPLRAAEGKKQK